MNFYSKPTPRFAILIWLTISLLSYVGMVLFGYYIKDPYDTNEILFHVYLALALLGLIRFLIAYYLKQATKVLIPYFIAIFIVPLLLPKLWSYMIQS